MGRVLGLAIAAAFAIGCGSKTGLELPDGGPDAGVDAAIPCIEIPLDSDVPTIEVPLATLTELRRADVLFLIDTTASMGDEHDRIAEHLRDRLAPAISGAIPDSQIGVATFADFPEDPFGSRDAGDKPFVLLLPVTSDLSRVQAAVNAVELNNGQDEPESQVEGLFQSATGEGLAGFVDPSRGCPAGGFGYPCFRTDALPIIFLFTDAPFHNGPTGENEYSGISPPPHTYVQARDALTANGIRVIGFNSGSGSAARDLNAIARDTGAVRADGSPLVFDIGSAGTSLDNSVINAIRTFADSVVFETIDAVLRDPDPGDGIDPLRIVAGIVPLRAEPMSGIDSIDFEANVFRGVRSGTTVVFQLVIRTDAFVPGPEPQRIRIEVIFRGEGRTFLGSQIVEIVIPAADGEGCPGGSMTATVVGG